MSTATTNSQEEPTANPQDEPTTDEVAKIALAELQFLCQQRYGDVCSPDLSEDALHRVRPRLAACLDALLTRGQQTIEWLVALLPAAEGANEICGIAIALLESRSPLAVTGILKSLETTEEGPKMRGLQMALRRGPLDLLAPTLQDWFRSGNARQAAAAAEALAFHRQIGKNASRLSELAIDAEPGIRRAAWRATAFIDGT
jgi:hypothetical protein